MMGSNLVNLCQFVWNAVRDFITFFAFIRLCYEYKPFFAFIKLSSQKTKTFI